MNKKQRELFANKIADLGNYAMIAMYFDSIVRGTSTTWKFPVIAGLFCVLCYTISYFRLKEKD